MEGLGWTLTIRTRGGLGLTLPSIFLFEKLNPLFLLYPTVSASGTAPPWQCTFHKRSETLAITGKTVTLTLDNGSFPSPSLQAPKAIPPPAANKQSVCLQSHCWWARALSGLLCLLYNDIHYAVRHQYCSRVNLFNLMRHLFSVRKLLKKHVCS